MTVEYPKQKYSDDEIKLLVFIMKASNVTVTIPMQWRNMRNFINDILVPSIGLKKGMLRLGSGALHVEGIDGEMTLGMMDLESIAGFYIADLAPLTKDQENLQKKAVDLQEKGIKIAEKMLRREEEGEEWKKCACGPERVSVDDGKRCVKCGKEIENSGSN